MMFVLCRNGLYRFLCYCVSLTILCLLFIYHDPSALKVIKKRNIYKNIRFETITSWPFSSAYELLFDCDYSVILSDSEPLKLPSQIADISIFMNNIQEGGQYFPECKPRVSTAIIVPYTHRDKLETLYLFIKYMHVFLRRQDINYRIYVIEQNDVEPYNTGKLLNIGAQYAMEFGYPCLILHEMNFVPLKPDNLYACTIAPRIMTSDTYNYGLLEWSTSTAVAITANQFTLVNGVSNRNENWTKNLKERLAAFKLEFCQYEPDINIYHQLDHKYDSEEASRPYVKTTKEEYSKDGITSLKHLASYTVLHPQFTHIIVDLKTQVQVKKSYRT